MPQLDPTWYSAQLVWLVICFGFLYVVLSSKILPALLGVMDARANKKQSDLDAAKALHQEAEHVKAEYERSMSDARERSRAIFTDAEVSIQNLSDNATKKLETELAEHAKEAENRISKHKRELLEQLEQSSQQMAADIVQKFTGRSSAEKTIKKQA